MISAGRNMMIITRSLYAYWKHNNRTELMDCKNYYCYY